MTCPALREACHPDRHVDIRLLSAWPKIGVPIPTMEIADRTLSLGGTTALLRHLAGELDNFEEIAQYLLPQPGDLPRLRGIDVFGGTLALNGRIGGDHLIYVDFKQRFNLPARIEDAVARGRTDL